MGSWVHEVQGGFRVHGSGVGFRVQGSGPVGSTDRELEP